MKITNLPTAELLRLLRLSERAKDPDIYALTALRREVERRMDNARLQPKVEVVR
jgi:hypothetical protein